MTETISVRRVGAHEAAQHIGKAVDALRGFVRADAPHANRFRHAFLLTDEKGSVDSATR